MEDALFFWILACASPVPPQGTWLAGDLHVHSSLGSNDTDGDGLPGVLEEAMATAGLDFLFLTDHSNSAGSMHCEDVEDCPNLGPEFIEADWPDGVLVGSEISPVHSIETTLNPTGHVGCLAGPLGFGPQVVFEDRPVGEVTGGEAVEQCLAAEGWPVINHPNAPAAWIAYDWSSEEFAALEVYNGGARFDVGDVAALAAWEERVAEGRSIVPVGGSDCHAWSTPAPGELLQPALGWPVTWVHEEGGGELEALEAGRVIVAEPGTDLSFQAVGHRRAVWPGGRIEGPVTLEATASALEPGLVLEIREVGGESLLSHRVGTEEVGLSVSVEAGRYYARVWPESAVGISWGGVALANAIEVH